VRKKVLEFEVAFGRNIRKLREELGWSQEQLAAAANIEPTQVSRIENSKHAATLPTIFALGVALGKYPYELFQFDFEIELNTDFQMSGLKNRGPEATKIVTELAKTNFFNTPKSVGDVVSHCKKVNQTQLKSPAISSILKKLTNERKLKRIPSPIKGKFLYKKNTK
jgi:transcriptional regulator with XRE-family HTH domain